MRSLIIWLDSKKPLIYRILLFLFSVVAIVLSFPREGRFPYEYQNGKPWSYEDYFAPFDFPVLKTMDELRSEKDSIFKQFKPYFNFNTKAETIQITLFREAFVKQWDAYAKDSIRNKSLDKRQTIESFFTKSSSTEKEYYLNVALDLFKFVYQKGIVEVNDQIEEKMHPGSNIMVIKNNVGEEHEFEDVFTLKTAYEYISQELDKRTNVSNQGRNLYETGFFKDLNLNVFLQPNLIYNEEASKNIKNELANQISVTKGMILANQRIIGKGEIVNDEKYNILFSLETEYENKIGLSDKFWNVLLGQIILVCVTIGVLYLFLGSFRKIVYQNAIKTGFIIILVVSMVSISSYLLSQNKIDIYVLPIVLLPIIIKTFYDARVALFVNSVVIVLIGFIAPNGFQFVLISFIAGVVAILSLTNVYRRSRLITTAMYVVGVYSIIFIGISLMEGKDFTEIQYRKAFSFLANGALLLFAYPLIYLFEKIFGFLSDIKLMELSDTNQPLLRELSEKAPGTFQHSLQVANIAEEAARKVGANAMLVRTGALYHDVGKMLKPMYFIENINTERNPHSDIPFEESAGIIIEHVVKGVEIAKRHRLPQQIIDFIRTHHGTSTVHFFYRSFMRQYPEREVERVKFTYPGPIPFTKEQALVMMADSVEAASRSLKEVNQKTINELVDSIIFNQMIEEQYNNAPITHKDITEVKEIFKRKLMNIYHVRVEYPEVFSKA